MFLTIQQWHHNAAPLTLAALFAIAWRQSRLIPLATGTITKQLISTDTISKQLISTDTNSKQHIFKHVSVYVREPSKNIGGRSADRMHGKHMHKINKKSLGHAAQININHHKTSFK